MSRVVLISNLPKDIEQVVLSYAPAGFDAVAISGAAPDEEKLALTREAEFLIVYGTGVSEALLRASPKVRHLQLLSAGYDRIDLNLTNSLSIPVSNNGGANSWAVAEATVGLILGLLRRLIEADTFVRAGKWRGTIQGFDTYELAGKTVGIVGLGNIGKKVARRLHAFETILRYTDEIPADPDLEEELGLERRNLDELLAEVDILTLHVPLLASTKRMIGPAQLARMKPSAVLINTCRGDVVDEPALIEALEKGTICAAGLDVFDKEPLTESPLFGMPNVMLSGHLAGTTYDTFFRRAQFAFENIQGIAAGREPMAVVTET